MVKTFVAVIEQEPRMAFEIQWHGDVVPQAIRFPDGSVIYNIGKYLSKGDRYCFQRVKAVNISQDNYRIVDFHYAVKE